MPKLPPLPKPSAIYAPEAYTVAQMQSYAQSAIKFNQLHHAARDTRLAEGTGKRATRARARLKKSAAATSPVYDFGPEYDIKDEQ